ncbi:hypothetical protein V3564_06510 [Bartonella sp. B12(2025)]
MDVARVSADLIENCFISMKSRGIYETARKIILFDVYRAMEFLILVQGAAHLKDELVLCYVKFIYYSFWFLSGRKML